MIFIIAIFGMLLLTFDFMSLMFFPAMYYNLHYICNDVDLVQITNIEKMDDFQCNIHVIGKHLNAIIYQVPCAIYDQKYNNTLVKFNHYNPNNCFNIISSKEQFPKSLYNDTIQAINFTYLCWIITIIGGSFLYIKENLKLVLHDLKNNV